MPGRMQLRGQSAILSSMSSRKRHHHRRKAPSPRVVRSDSIRTGGWVAPLQGDQFLGLSGSVGPDANGDTGISGDSGSSGDGSGGSV